MMAETEGGETTNLRWIAFDIGGANLKAVHSSGIVRSTPFELWRYPTKLADAIAQHARSMPWFDRVAVTMTAELCDCFATKRIGVLAVLDAVEAAVGDRTTWVWGIDGAFRSLADMRSHPELAAASNWLALATVASRLDLPRESLLIDIGSTTVDLIPIIGGKVGAIGRTDTERLQRGELVYAGVRRTPLFALADRVPFRGRATRMAAELFATTLDLFLTLGDLSEDSRQISTADGRPATREFSRDRLARMVCADRDGFDTGDALRLSMFLQEALLSRLFEACRSQLRPRPDAIIVAGSGEFLARRLATRLVIPGGRIIALGREWGRDASESACAWALASLARDQTDRLGERAN